MKAVLSINGINLLYPDEINTLEELLIHAMETEMPNDRLVTEVRVDGELYSEDYAHQARYIELSDIRQVELVSISSVTVADHFLKKAPIVIDHVRQGFQTSAEFLRNPFKETEGYELFARSLEALVDTRAHIINARKVVRKTESDEGNRFWKRFETQMDRMTSAQEEMNTWLIADLLEDEMVPLLAEWRGLVETESAKPRGLRSSLVIKGPFGQPPQESAYQQRAAA